MNDQRSQSLTPTDRHWDPAPLIDWLLDEGRFLKHPKLLIAELGNRLKAQGVPLMRMRISMRTLHPQVVGRAYTWWRGKDEVETYSPPHSIIQSSDYLGSPIESVQKNGKPFRCRLELEAALPLHGSLQTLREAGATDYVALPMRFNHDDVASPWILTTDAPGGFSDQDLIHFNRIIRVLTPVLEVLALQMTTRSLLDTYLGPRTGRKVFNGQIKRGDGELIEAAIWYSDMRDSTAITEALNHKQLLQLLNDYFEVICDAVTAQGGEVLRFIGDAMLVVFPTEGQRTLKQACKAALAAAQAACTRMQEVNAELETQGLPAIRYGLGLDVGEVIYGNVGARERLDFTVMGSAVNRAARIENLTKEAGCPMLVSEPFSHQLDGTLRCAGEFSVPGVKERLKVFCAPCDQGTA
jgi:adenylate cyclase